MKKKIEDFSKHMRTKLMTRKKAYDRVELTEEGKKVFADIYKFSGINRPSYVEGNPDRTAYNEGMKRVALHIKGILNQSDIDVEKVIADYSKSVDYDPFNQ